jgi:hypothetical protein
VDIDVVEVTAKERSEFVRKRKAILGLGLVAVPKWECVEHVRTGERRVALRKRARSARSSEKRASGRILGPKTKRRGKERNRAKQRTNGVDVQVMDEGTVEQV